MAPRMGACAWRTRLAPDGGCRRLVPRSSRPAVDGTMPRWRPSSPDTNRPACDAGMRRNAVHSYWDYARRFLDWRTGDYRPRGVTGYGRPVPDAPVTADTLEQQARTYAEAIQAAGREQATIDTYHRHAMFFVRWLRGDFRPGGRLP